MNRLFPVYLIFLLGLWPVISQESHPLSTYMGQTMVVTNHYSLGTYTSYQTVNPTINGDLLFQTKSDTYYWEVLSNKELQVQESRAQYFDPFFQGLSKMKTFLLERSQNGEYYCSRTNHRSVNRTLRSSMENGLDITMVKYILLINYMEQGLIPLVAELFDPARLKPYRMELTPQRIAMDQLISMQEDYHFPEEWESLLQSSNDAVFVQGRLMGLPGKVYPHPFNYLLDEDYRVIMEWGGSPDDPYFAHFQFQSNHIE